MKTKIPAVEGWFNADPARPRLLGTRCKECSTYFFPKEEVYCRNPQCASETLEEVELSPRGKLWSFTNNCYPPPLPYVASDPFEPYVVAAVELDEERMVVLGQVPASVKVEDLKAGLEMELAIETLNEDDEHEYLIWKWQPVATA